MTFFDRHPLPRTLAAHPGRSDILRIMDAALQAVDPGEAVRRQLRKEKGLLHVGSRTYLLDGIRRIFLAGGGKAAAPMAAAAVEALGERLTAGFLVTKYGHLSAVDLPDHVRLVEAGHPVPDSRGVRAANEMLDLLQGLHADDLVICLISGGGSALLAAPAEGVSLQALEDLNARLLASGADIREVNTVRKHLSRIKGGQLAARCAPARVVSLVLSDVVGDPLDAIASGPTAPDPTSAADAHRVLEKYNIPFSVSFVETPQPGDPLFERVDNILIGTNRIAADAASAEAEALGFSSKVLTSSLVGEARDAGRWLAAHAADMPAGSIWIAGGETTVTLKADHGLGGRNLETALAAVPLLDSMEDILIITLATDGGDGPTDAAGAVASGETARRAADRGLSPQDFLDRQDAYPFFEALGDLIITGPTRTNVNDLAILIKHGA